MEQLNSDTVAIATDKLASTNIQVSSHVQRNGRRKLEDRFVVENDLNSAFDLDVSWHSVLCTFWCVDVVPVRLFVGCLLKTMACVLSVCLLLFTSLPFDPFRFFATLPLNYVRSLLTQL